MITPRLDHILSPFCFSLARLVYLPSIYSVKSLKSSHTSVYSKSGSVQVRKVYHLFSAVNDSIFIYFYFPNRLKRESAMAQAGGHVQYRIWVWASSPICHCVRWASASLHFRVVTGTRLSVMTETALLLSHRFILLSYPAFFHSCRDSQEHEHRRRVLHWSPRVRRRQENVQELAVLFDALRRPTSCSGVLGSGTANLAVPFPLGVGSLPSLSRRVFLGRNNPEIIMGVFIMKWRKKSMIKSRQSCLIRLSCLAANNHAFPYKICTVESSIYAIPIHASRFCGVCEWYVKPCQVIYSEVEGEGDTGLITCTDWWFSHVLYNSLNPLPLSCYKYFRHPIDHC